jgi:hypothetical protein
MTRSFGLLIAWFRFGGWHNVYWREDYYMAICDHPVEVQLVDEWMTICGSCGAVIR